LRAGGSPAEGKVRFAMLMNLLLTLNILVCIALTGVVLLQRSEGGALGTGGGPTGLITTRGAGDLLTRTTWILFTLFVLLSLGMTLWGGHQRSSQEILDRLKLQQINPDAVPAQTAPTAPAPTPTLPTDINPAPLPAAPGLAPTAPAPTATAPLAAPTPTVRNPAARPRPATSAPVTAQAAPPVLSVPPPRIEAAPAPMEVPRPPAPKAPATTAPASDAPLTNTTP